MDGVITPSASYSDSSLLDEKMSLSQLKNIRDRIHGDDVDVMARLEGLRSDVQEKDIIIQSLRRNLVAEQSTHSQQVLLLRKELHELKEALKVERLRRNTVTDGKCMDLCLHASH